MIAVKNVAEWPSVEAVKSVMGIRLEEAALGYKVSIMTGEFSDRENGIRESIDILKFKAQKMAQEYEAVKCKFKDSGLKLSADMANYIIHTGQKDAFVKYQRQIESIEHQRGR